MLLRHLETLLAIAEEGSFTGPPTRSTPCSRTSPNRCASSRAELGVPLLVRSRRAPQPTEFGAVVLERARHVDRELEAMHDDLSMLRGLEAGHAHLGVVGTASRWLVPGLVDDLHDARRVSGCG